MQTKKIHIHYYAILREERGRHTDVRQTTAQTPSQLYRELKDRHGFSMSWKHLRVAINDEFQDGNTKLKNGDTVAFIPPVAGG